MKKFAILIISAALFLPLNALGIEIMSNDSLDSISGKAVTDNPAFNDPEVALPFFSSEQILTSYTQGTNGVHKTVAVEFTGRDSIDAAGNVYHEEFYATPSVYDLYYETSLKDEDVTPNTFTQLCFEGFLKGKVVVPEYFDGDPAMKSREVSISQARIDLPAGMTGNYLCSYQGNIYESGSIPDADQSFKVYPNLQTITVGSAENGDLAILLPHGSASSTVWKPVVKSYNPLTSETEYLIIPQGKKFIHIGLNHMIMRNDIQFKVRFTHTDTKWKGTKENPLPPDMNQTLGTIAMSGGDTTINGGDVFITINDSL